MKIGNLSNKLKYSAVATVSRKVRGKAEQLAVSSVSVIQSVRARNENESFLFKGPNGPRLATVDENLNLPSLGESNRQTVESKVNELGILHWNFDGNGLDVPVINMLSDDFSRLLMGLAADRTFANWYFRELLPNGRPSLKEELFEALKSKTGIAGVRIYRYVSSGKTSSFFADAVQGVDIFRWTQGVSEEQIQSQVWNPCATELPSPTANPHSWDSALEVADSTFGYTVDFPIDAVITWVDGEDVEWKKRKNSALGHSVGELVKDATDVSRFETLDELRYCLRSIEQYAPWIRKIYIVTDNQVPNWLSLAMDSKVRIVDHSEIWKDTSELPVFNSHAIESNLHRIDSLSEHFLYFNDDMLLTSPVTPEHFFHPNGITKVFYSRALVDLMPISGEDNVSTVAAKNARRVLSGDGFPIYTRKFYHTPYALRVSVMNEMEQRYPEIFSLTSSAKFRSQSDAALAGSFYFNFALSTGRAVPGRIKYDYIDPADGGAISRLRNIIKRRNMDVVVVNDGSQVVSESKRNEIRRKIPQLLEDLLPVRSSFEK
ncbi:stealth conserved region 3 domain-containing protein [Glutamicibacter arilaitensis]|uniref:stealth conserved region 3 domain-containing protein n=1 Tax=Glutamicibacter arilaitensis TaxID=256701 RepID=UPI003F9C4BB1